MESLLVIWLSGTRWRLCPGPGSGADSGFEIAWQGLLWLQRRDSVSRSLFQSDLREDKSTTGQILRSREREADPRMMSHIFFCSWRQSWFMGFSSSFSLSGNFFPSQASSQCLYQEPWLLYHSASSCTGHSGPVLQLQSQGLPFWCTVFKGTCVWGGSEVLSHGAVESSQ